MSRKKERSRVAFFTLGCKANRYDTAALMAMVPPEHYEIMDETIAGHGPFVADIYVVNTCAVTSQSAFQSRQMIRRVRRWNPRATVVAVGCLAELEPASLEAAGADWVWGVSERARAAEFFGGTEPEAAPLFYHPEAGCQFRGRAVVKVQDGCDQRCSYCVVFRLRGPSRSLPVPAVLQQLEAVVARGFREAVLTGIHLGLYGADHGSSLAALLEAIAAARLPLRLRLSSLEPQELSDELISLFASFSWLCPHLHLPIQSGDDYLLARMGRPYTVEEFRERLLRFHHALPHAAIGLDLIAGFPGETDSAHQNTVAFLHALPASYFHVFPFSPRPGTPAAEFPDRVSAAVVKERARELRELGAEKRRKFLEAQKGRTLQVLVEEHRAGMLVGTSENYVRVSFAGPAEYRGRIVPVGVEATDSRQARGKAMEVAEEEERDEQKRTAQKD